MSEYKNERMMCPDCQKEISRKSWSYHQTTIDHQFNTNYAKPKPLEMKGKKEAYCSDCDRWMTKRGLKHHQKT